MGKQRILHMCNYLKNNLCHTNSLFVPSDNIKKTIMFMLKADTGASKHFVKDKHKKYLSQLQQQFNGPKAMLPNKATIAATHKGSLPMGKKFSTTAREAFVYPKLTNESLLSIGQLCDDDCLAIFSKRYLHVLKNKKSS